MKRDFGFRFARVFDTMIAMRFLGAKEVGLQATLSSELGVAISKQSQRDDWSRRPLTAAQEAYAAADVSHLVRLHDRLVDRLEGLGRLGWVEEECEVVAALEPARRRAGDDAYLRVRGAQGLSRRGLAILRELHGWRERLAEETDTPAFKLLGAEALITLAERAPRTLQELAAVRGVRVRPGPRSESLLEAVRRGQAVPPDALPRFPRSVRPVVPEPVKARREALKRWRAQEAERLALDISVVLPQRLIDRIADAPPAEPGDLARVEGIRRWRLEAFAPAIMAALVS
jgi:ribonuclease D